jgi:hypothetical protein
MGEWDIHGENFHRWLSKTEICEFLSQKFPTSYTVSKSIRLLFRGSIGLIIVPHQENTHANLEY